MAIRLADANDASTYHNANVGDWILDDADTTVYLRNDWGQISAQAGQKLLIHGTNFESIDLYFGGTGGVEGNEFIITCLEDQAIINLGVFNIHGLKHFKLTGKYDAVNQTGSASAKYGIKIEGPYLDSGVSGLVIGHDYYPTTDQGSDYVEVEYIESGGVGYAAFQCKNDDLGDSLDGRMHVKVHHCYFHDAISGEGIYAGNTKTAVAQGTIYLEMYECKFARTGIEGLQLGRLGEGSKIYNNVLVCAGLSWLAPFQNYQDKSVQFQPRTGGVIFEKNIIIGGSQMIIFFDNTGDDVKISDWSYIRDNYFGFHRGNWMYIHSSNFPEANLRIQNNIFGQFTFRYDRRDNVSTPSGLVQCDNTVVPIEFIDNIKEDARNLLYPNTPSNVTESGTLTQSVDRPLFVDSGFDDTTVDWTTFENWHSSITVGDNIGDPITFPTGWHVFHKGKTYKAIQDATQIEPGVTVGWSSYWEQVTFNGEDMPPDDFTNVVGSTYDLLGWGLQDVSTPTGIGPITYDAELLALWRSRWTNGYSPIANRPDGKSESVARSVFYHANPGTDYVTTDVRTTDPAYGQYIVSAAFQYLMDGTGGATVHDQLLAQVQEAGCDYGSFPDSDLGTIGNATVRFSSSWVVNMFLVYDYTYDLYTAGERAIIDAWFYDAAVFFQRSLSQGVFETQFPNRNADDNYLTNAALVADQAAHTTGRFYYSKETNLNYELTGSKTGSINDYTARAYAQRDYTVTAGATSTGSMSTRYTHRDNSNVLQNKISDSGAFWSNQQAMMVRVVALGGKYFNNAMMQDHSKLWAEESLKYGTYPDGTMTEYRRNETATPMLGSSFYGMIIVEGLIMVADLYPDDSVWEYSTSVGIHGTAGGTKNIRLLIERVMQICTTVYDDADSIYFYEGKSEANLLDTQRTATYRYLPEVPLSWANRYYQEDAIKEVYLLTAANSNPYSATGEYPFGTIIEWGGANANFPEFVYMFHETEYLYAPEQAPTASAGIDKAITLPTNSVIIYGTAIPGTGSIVSTVWTQISGPNTAGLSGDTTTTLTASSLIEGTYVFRLTVTDDTPLVDFDDVSVVVYPTPLIPENAFGTLHLLNI